jgi:hypothetical protein
MKVFKIDIGYLLILAFCIEELIRSFITGSTFDFHFHDTMFVIRKFYWWEIMTLYFLLMLAVNHYLLKNGFRGKRFQWVILIITVLSITIINILIQISDQARSLLNASAYLNRSEIANLVVSVILLILIAIQFVFWGYFVVAVIRKKFFGKGVP